MVREIIKPTSDTYTIQIPKEYINKEVEVKILSKENDDYKFWSEEEIKNIGKIGLISSSFENDEEDYSKW